ncbi:hypothetical protein [Streptomyces sp. NPDC095817]|uniref:hypothetical protein n=1 Tax=Streptomyces sp. NPDC095817 TaxID=3155082 RepID=UPI0033235EF4
MLNSAFTADADWLTVATTAAFSAAVLISAIAEIRVGRTIDHRAPEAAISRQAGEGRSSRSLGVSLLGCSRSLKIWRQIVRLRQRCASRAVLPLAARRAM